MKEELTPSQEKFCILVGLPGEDGKFPTLDEAYRTAFPDFTGKYAKQEGYKLKQIPAVRQRIKQYRSEWRKSLIEEHLSQEKLIARLGRIVDSEQEFAAIQAVQVGLKLHNDNESDEFSDMTNEEILARIQGASSRGD
jgi:hypothetical protein